MTIHIPLVYYFDNFCAKVHDIFVSHKYFPLFFSLYAVTQRRSARRDKPLALLLLKMSDGNLQVDSTTLTSFALAQDAGEIILHRQNLRHYRRHPRCSSPV